MGRKKYDKGILDDMEGDIDIDGYEEYQMPLDDKNNDLKNDLANVKKAQKNQGYRDRLYSSSGIIIEGPEK